MKFTHPVCISALSPLSLRRPADFLDAVRAYCELFPDVLPEKWGWWKPLNREFHTGQVEALVPASGKCETVFWQRKKHPKAEGSFAVRWHSKSSVVNDTHANVDLALEMAAVDQSVLVHGLKGLSRRTQTDIAILDVATASYKKLRI